MKHATLRLIFTLTIALACIKIHAQKIEGLAIYEVKRIPVVQKDTLELKDKAKKITSRQAIMRNMERQLAGPAETEYELRFNQIESSWKNVASLNRSSKEQFSYRNMANKQSQIVKDIFGKPFIVQAKLKPMGWQLVDDHRKIGDYHCQKATLVDPEDKNRFISAWFTEEIPISSGPVDYYGLPGLILMVNDGTSIIRCTKLTLNPKKRLKISKPKGGKTLSREEFDQLLLDKMKEQMKTGNYK